MERKEAIWLNSLFGRVIRDDYAVDSGDLPGWWRVGRVFAFP